MITKMEKLMVKKEKILVADDQPDIVKSISGLLEDNGYEVKGAGNSLEVEELLKSESFDLLLLDVWMPQKNGIQLLKWLRENQILTPVIIISAQGTIDLAVEATKSGAYDFLEKPLNPERFLLTVKNALKISTLQEENRNLKSVLEERYRIVGESQVMTKMFSHIKKAAESESKILIMGENGSGKELVARAIHEGSLKKDKPFVKVNCAAIPKDLIESELFGHEKGAFTNAIAQKKGKFELADGGTLFLDEVGDTSLAAQSKLLRVLEQREFERVGGTHTIKIDVRVIAATNKNLPSEIEKGAFREDLYYRLNVIPLLVPPLRERKDDMPLLIDHFLTLFANETNKKRKSFTSQALAYLCALGWPGNVRELKNFVERVIILSDKDEIDQKEAERFLDLGSGEKEDDSSPDEKSLSQTLEELEKVILINELKKAGGNIAKAAEKLKVDRGNLSKKLKKLGIV